MTYTHTNFPEEQGAKLVRDKIPEIIEANEKVKARTRILNEAEFIDALVNKLTEEGAELKHAVADRDNSHIMEEIGDNLEVLQAIAKACSVDFDEVIKMQNHKKDIRGGFDKRILLLGKE